MSLSFGGDTLTSSSSSEQSIKWIDLTSRLSVVGGYLSGRYNNNGLYNLWMGYAVASDKESVSGSHNTGLGTYAAFKNQGDYNTWVGSRSGFENLTGSENVGVGWNAGAQQTDARGNTSLGFQGGANALGDGNVSVGHNANSSGAEFHTTCNIAVGSASHATGGDSIAIGADTNAGGRGSTVIGAGSTSSAANSVVVGPYVNSTGENSLLIMPRADGRASTHTADDELNIYGVLLGGRSSLDRSYGVTLGADAVAIKARGVEASARQGVLHFEASSNIAFLTESTFAGKTTHNAPVVFSDSVVFVDGFRSGSIGDSVFDGRVVFNGPMELRSSLDIRDLAVDSLAVRDLRVTGSAQVPEDFLKDPLFDTVRVLGQSQFYGGAVFKSGIHVCCAPVSADTVEAHTTRTHHLYVDGDFSVSNARVSFRDIEVGEARVEKLFADNGYVLSNLAVTGDLTANGNVYASHAFLGEIMASSISTTGTITSEGVYSSNIVCDTITVTGGNTLKVFGNSVLNTTSTNRLVVNDRTDMDTLVINKDVYVGTHTDTDTLNVRSGVVIAQADIGSLSTGGLTAQAVTACNIAAAEVQGGDGTFSGLSSLNSHFGAMSASNAAVATLHTHSASACNLTVDTLTLVNGLDTGNMSFFNTDLTGVTTAGPVEVSGNALFRQDVTVDGKLTADLLEITGGFSVNTGLPFIFDDAVIANREAVFRQDVKIEGELRGASATLSGALTASAVGSAGDISLEGCLKWENPLSPLSYQWDACLVNNTGATADLRFKSSNGTTFTLTDDFEAGVLNFTGKHRCTWLDRTADSTTPGRGMIVVTTGEFNNLDGGAEPTMDEALPVVRLSTRADDPKAFGVVAGEEGEGGRLFRLANMVFSHGSCKGDPKIIVNSVGEGGMWVTDANGPVANGDLLTTSDVAGHAQLQGDDIVRSKTVAKITGHPERWEAYRDPASGRECNRAFCGVVYKF